MASEPTIPLVPRRRVTGPSFGGLRSARRGSGADLAGTRLYRRGDDVRHIDRLASARLSVALDRDEFVVREHFAAEATRVVVVADRRPSMALFPSGLPWLSKPAALDAVARLVEASAVRARCGLRRVDHLGVELEEEPRDFDAPEDTLERALAGLALSRLGAGSFVFCVSDFCMADATRADAWEEAVARGWDLVPVVVQDAVWEQSFPDVGGAVLPVYDPYARRVRATMLSARECRERRQANEERLAALLERFEALGLDPILVARHDADAVFEAFREWAEGRRPGVRARP